MDFNDLGVLQMFSDLFDPLIQAKYNYGPNQRQYHDTDVTKLRFPYESEADLNVNKYILSSRIRVTRNLSGFSFPTFCTRAERREIEKKFQKAFEQFNQGNEHFRGNYYRLSTIDEREQEKLVNVSTSMSLKESEENATLYHEKSMEDSTEVKREFCFSLFLGWSFSL